MTNLSRKFHAINVVLLLFVIVLLFPADARAQTDTPEVPVEKRGTPAGEINWTPPHRKSLQGAPVVVNGEVLFHLVGISSFPAKDRAKLNARRIVELAENAGFDPETLRVEKVEGGYIIFAGSGDNELLPIIKEDAQLEGADINVVVEIFKEKIAKAIGVYRYERQPDVLRANIISAVLRTLGLAFTLLIAHWLFHQVDSFLEKQIKTRIEKLEEKSLRIIKAEQIWNVFRFGLRVLRILIVLLIAWVFLHFVLNLFPLTRYFSNTAFGYIINPLRNMGLAVIGYLPSLIFLVLLYYATRYLLKLIYQYFSAVERGRIKLSNFDAEWSLPTYRIVRVAVILLAIVLAYPYIPGSDSQAFKGISIIFGLLLSLGSTSVISNVMAGYAMTYRSAFSVGDRVKIGDTIGDVLETRILVTRVRSLKNEEVIIPNSTIMNNEVTNYSKLARDQGLILHTTVGIGYEVPWRQVEAMLLLAADRTEGISKDPKPFVLQSALADFAVNYELNAYCRDEKRATILYSELHRNIQDVFNEYEVSIMTPAYEADTLEPKLVSKDQWYADPAAKIKR